MNSTTTTTQAQFAIIEQMRVIARDVMAQLKPDTSVRHSMAHSYLNAFLTGEVERTAERMGRTAASAIDHQLLYVFSNVTARGTLKVPVNDLKSLHEQLKATLN